MSTVCVTGATGFIASHIVAQLLSAGYNVRGTVRSLERSNYGFLKQMGEKHDNRLTLVEADLMKESSFDEAMSGCDYCVHTAAVVSLHSSGDPMKTIIEPAIKGTLNVLKSCARAKTIKRVVYTSSAEAVMSHRAKPPPVTTEEHWDTKCTQSSGAYIYAKRLSEQRAWAFVEETKAFEMITICPHTVLGPILGDRVALSNSAVESILSGAYPLVPAFNLQVCDVRDVARAHVLALSKEQANGRYIVTGRPETLSGLAARLQKLFPTKPISSLVMPAYLMYMVVPFEPRLDMEDVTGFIFYKPTYCNDKAIRDLSLEFTDMDVTLRDTAQSMIDKHLVKTAFHATKEFFYGAIACIFVLVACGYYYYVI